VPQLLGKVRDILGHVADVVVRQLARGGLDTVGEALRLVGGALAQLLGAGAGLGRGLLAQLLGGVVGGCVVGAGAVLVAGSGLRATWLDGRCHVCAPRSLAELVGGAPAWWGRAREGHGGTPAVSLPYSQDAGFRAFGR